ncbi:unnamed protein product [Boreogadus saida]
MEFAWLSLFLALGGLRGARGLQEVDVFPSRGGDIRDFTVAARWVYVVTGDYLYQLNLSLGLLHSLTQRGEYIGSSFFGQFKRTLEGGASTFSVNTLAPLVERNLLLTCGALNCGFCEMLNLTDITRILREAYELNYVVPKGISVGFVVDVKEQSYILSAAEEFEGINDKGCVDIPEKSRIRLHNTNETQLGGLLSFVYGIFTDHDVTNTELAIYDVSPPTDAPTYRDPDFGYRGEPWKLMRVPVSQCVQHSSLESCWNARDPYCGWCGALRRCSFEDECPSSLWLSIPDDLSQRRILSHSFQEDAEGKIRLAVFTHLKRGGAPANFSCRFDSSVGVLGGLGHQYPECTCLLPPVIGQ